MNKVRKAVIPVAGFGTRFLPATKAMPKELLPIVDKPLIQYAAEEAIAAGIDTLIFVTGRHKRAIEDHFDSNPELEFALRAKGKHAQADMVRNILPQGVECIFVRQLEPLGLGHAVLCAERAVGDETFAVLLADDFLASEGDGATADFVEAYARSGKAQISLMDVDGPDIAKYGVVKPGTVPGAVAGLIEKPTVAEAPSNMASIGRYVLPAEIFAVLRDQPPGAGEEIQLADAINTLALSIGTRLPTLIVRGTATEATLEDWALMGGLWSRSTWLILIGSACLVATVALGLVASIANSTSGCVCTDPEAIPFVKLSKG